MSSFHYKGEELYVEGVPLSKIACEYGTPTYVYSRDDIETAYRNFDRAFGDYPHSVCYSVKANSNIAVLNILANLGSGFDIVSGGELQRVLKAGGTPSKVVFSGVGKTREELIFALKAGIGCFNVESPAELDLLQCVGQEVGLIAPASVRVNPDVDAGTHPYISTGLKENKFGVSRSTAVRMYVESRQMKNVNMIGIDCHIGSQITEIAPIIEAIVELKNIIDELASYGIELEHVDLGGGVGVRYKDEVPIALPTYAEAVINAMGEHQHRLLFEPGRQIVANAGILLTKVELLKTNHESRFAIVDAAMNDLIRPALYGSWQNISEVKKRHKKQILSVVGPICETADFFAHEREIAVEPGDLLAIEASGAYGFVMSSNYNSRNRAAEVMVSGSKHYCIRARETIEHQLLLERTLPGQENL